MLGFLDTAGERLALECQLPWLSSLLEEGAAGQIQAGSPPAASLRIAIEDEHRPFDLGGWQPLTRGAWQRDGAVIMENACTSGFDLQLRVAGPAAEFKFRWRPPARHQLAHWVLRGRFRLLTRAILLQYPALWWAGVRGRAPLHASACRTATAVPLLAAAGGIGRSTLLMGEMRAGAPATGDNLCVADGICTWGLVEPVRVEGGRGRKMPFGRREARLPSAPTPLEPDRVVVLRRGLTAAPVVRRCDPETAARALVAGTYMAGELARFWPFAATLTAATGRGNAHPPVARVASAFTGRLPCLEVVLARRPGPRLSELLEPLEAIA